MKEVRYIQTEISEKRDMDNPSIDSRTICATAIVYNTWSTILYHEERKVFFREMVMPGAATGLLNNDVICSRSHENDQIIARTSAGTLALYDDADALRYECRCPETTAGNNTLIDVRVKNITGSSCEFIADPENETWTRGTNGIYDRVIKRFKVFLAVNPVVYPANQFTEVEARAAEFVATFEPTKTEPKEEYFTKLKYKLK